jgi:hypothetical protein
MKLLYNITILIGLFVVQLIGKAESKQPEHILKLLAKLRVPILDEVKNILLLLEKFFLKPQTLQ